MQQNLTMTLADGRQLGFAEYGDPKGYPVFYFHGFPGSRLQAADFDTHAQGKHCRFFGVDRPGMGLSSSNQQHTLLSWAKDIRELTDYLGIKQFSIIAHSGGAPFALACAEIMPERVLRVALVSGIAPTTLPEAAVGMPRALRIINVLVRNIPFVSWALMKLQQNVLLRPTIFKKMIQQLPEVDRIICQKPEQMNQLLMASKEAFKQGVNGAAYEFRLILKEWGFSLKNIHTPISVWQGRLDPQLPLSHAKIYEHLLPEVQCKIFDNEAHLSTLYNHIDEILTAVQS